MERKSVQKAKKITDRSVSRFGVIGSQPVGPGNRLIVYGALALMAYSPLSACATVKVEAPDEPIEINLNVNIQQEVRFKIEREIEDLIADNPDIF